MPGRTRGVALERNGYLAVCASHSNALAQQYKQHDMKKLTNQQEQLAICEERPMLLGLPRLRMQVLQLRFRPTSKLTVLIIQFASILDKLI